MGDQEKPEQEKPETETTDTEHGKPAPQPSPFDANPGGQPGGGGGH